MWVFILMLLSNQSLNQKFKEAFCALSTLKTKASAFTQMIYELIKFTWFSSAVHTGESNGNYLDSKFKPLCIVIHSDHVTYKMCYCLLNTHS